MVGCEAYCSHGAKCTKDTPHPGEKHDASGMCEWTDEESITRTEADAIVLSSGHPLARVIVDIGEFLERLIEEGSTLEEDG